MKAVKHSSSVLGGVRGRFLRCANALFVLVGLSFVITHGRSGFFCYKRLVSRERFSQNSLAFGLRLEF